MKNKKDKNDFVGIQAIDNTPDVSTPGLISDDEITEQEKAAAWAEFEAEMRMMDYENNFPNTYK